MADVRIKLKTRLAGPSYGVLQPGTVLSVPERVAGDLIAGGFAELTTEPAPAVQEATAVAPERAVSKRKRKPAARKRGGQTTK